MDWSGVEGARQQAQSAAQTATDYAVKGNTLADELRKAVGERYAQSDLAKNTATARSNFLTAAPQARADVLNLVQSGNILSPTQQNAIMAAKRASALVPLSAGNLMEQAAFGTMEDLINAGVNSWNAKTQAAQGAARLAESNYSSMLDQLLKQAQEERYREEDKRTTELFPLQKQQLLAQIAATNRSNTSGGGSVSLTPVEIDGQMYNYNSRTGEYTKANVSGSKSKYSEVEKANYANAISDGSLKITQVPQDIRGEVQQLVDQIEASKPWYQKPWFGLGDLFR